MRRRRFVAALPGAASLAGCLGRSDDTESPPTDGTGSGGTTRSANRSETGTTGTGTPALSVTLRASFRYYHSNDAIGVELPRRDQFAFVTPPVADPSAEPVDFTLALGERRLSPRDSVPGFAAATPGVDSVFTAERSGALLFDVPTVDTDTATLHYGDEAFAFSGTEQFATAPEIAVTAVAPRERQDPTADVVVDVSASNEGGADGLVLGGLRRGGQPQTYSFRVPAGERVEETVTYDLSGDREVTALGFSGHDESLWIQLPDGSRTATTPS